MYIQLTNVSKKIRAMISLKISICAWNQAKYMVSRERTAVVKLCL